MPRGRKKKQDGNGGNRPEHGSTHNGPTQAQSQLVVSALEGHMADLRAEKILYDNRCRPIRQAIADAIQDAVDRLGFDKSALKITVKQREYDRKSKALEADLDIVSELAMKRLKEDLGMLADTPLGQAAQAAANVRGPHPIDDMATPAG
jgi:hypothetical protein